MSTKFVLNETSYFGKGAREELSGEIQKRGFKKVFLVSDKALVDAGVTSKVEKVLNAANIPYVLYDEIKPNPTIQNVTDGVSACKKSKADVIVAVGGGSSIDTAKGISIVMTNPYSPQIIHQYLIYQYFLSDILRFIAIEIMAEKIILAFISKITFQE